MTRDRSLDEFATDEAGGSAGSEGSDGSEESGDGDESGGGVGVEPGQEVGAEAGESDGPTRADSVEPATATYQWDPEGIACADCGEVVDRLWVQEDERVCADCKEW